MIHQESAIPAPRELQVLQLCLSFANTQKWHASAQPIEQITSYGDLLDWAAGTGLLDAATKRRLSTLAARDQAAAEATYQAAIKLREAIYRIFAGLTNGQTPDMRDLAYLNVALGQALAHLRIDHTGDDYVWGWENTESLDRVVWPIARSAGELLTSAWRGRIGQCADDRGCGWLFIDTSKNHSRRWCDINDCGNRAKARRHYQRVREQRG